MPFTLDISEGHMIYPEFQRPEDSLDQWMMAGGWPDVGVRDALLGK